MNVAIEYIGYLNEKQTAVGCLDCPLYAWKKKIQWACPSRFPMDKYFAFLGGLHIEQVALKAHGTLIKGTGLSDIIKGAGFTTIGLDTAVNDVNHIKKACYTVQLIYVLSSIMLF